MYVRNWSEWSCTCAGFYKDVFLDRQSNMEALMVQLIAELDLSSNTGFTMDKQNLQDLLSTAKPNEMAQLRQALLEKQSV